MKKDFLYIFSSPLARFSAYITLFAIILASTEALRSLLANPRSDTSILLFLASLGFFIIIGSFISERNVLSRSTSFAVMLVLTAITTIFNSAALPSSLPLILALVTSFLGAQPFLHKKPSGSKRRTIFYSTGIITLALAVAVAVIYITVVLTRAALYNNPPL